MTSTCPCCGEENCKAVEIFSQATRSTPMTSLGYQGYCPTCDLCFKVETPQLTLAA